MNLEKAVEIIREKFGQFEPWIVGSAAKKLAGHKYFSEPKDIDVILTSVPRIRNSKYAMPTLGISDNIRQIINSLCPQWMISTTYFGGTKFYIGNAAEGWNVDMWEEDDMSTYLSRCPTAYDGFAYKVNNGEGMISFSREYHEYLLSGKNFEITTRPTKVHPMKSGYKLHLERQGIRV